MKKIWLKMKLNLQRKKLKKKMLKYLNKKVNLKN